MPLPVSRPYTPMLRSLMQQAEISSFRVLSQRAGVSDWQVEQLRRGKATQMRLDVLHRLSRALKISLMELLNQFTDLPQLTLGIPESTGQSLARQPEQQLLDEFKQEYQRLQGQLQAQQETLQQEFQRSSLQILESWLLQFPTAAYAAQQNPEIPAVRLLPLLRPVEQLLQSWGVESIAPVGTELAYDPHQHQLMDGTAQPGDRVRVRYTGYRQGERLLYRVKVSPIASS